MITSRDPAAMPPGVSPSSCRLISDHAGRIALFAYGVKKWCNAASMGRHDKPWRRLGGWRDPVSGINSRNAVHGTPRAAPEATSFCSREYGSRNTFHSNTLQDGSLPGLTTHPSSIRCSG